MTPPVLDILVNILLIVVGIVHYRNRPWVRHLNRKVVTDDRLGKIGLSHFDSPTKNCFDYGCTNDCPIGGRR
jgi:hypothetical protein